VNHIDTAAFYFSALRSANELINRALAPCPVGVDRLDRRAFSALAQLRDAGLIRHLGVSNVSPGHLAQAQVIAPVVCVQNRYGIGARRPDADDFLRACGAQGIAFLPFFAIAGAGREAGASDADDDAVFEVARAHGATAAQVKLAWTLQRGPHVLAIPGTGNPDHLAANLAADALRRTK
jgi:pyridoxine 4-dehydrogenase